MLQYGFIQKWLQKYTQIPSLETCEKKATRVEAKAATLADLSGAFVLLAIGLITASLIILAEVMHGHSTV